MIDLQFWYVFLGIMFLFSGLQLVFSPDGYLRVIKSVSRKRSTLSVLGYSYMFVVLLMGYSSRFLIDYADVIIFVMAVLGFVKSLLLAYSPKWFMKNWIKKTLKWKTQTWRTLGVISVILGIAGICFGILYL